MVWITFSFLLALPINDNEKLEENYPKPEEKYQTHGNHIEIEVSKPFFLCHIEYVLLPSELPKFIDVVCWEGAAKIYFEDSTSAIIPLKVGKLQWIHFRINHKVNVEVEDTPVFHAHVIKFSVFLDGKKLGDAAKADKPKKFYGPEFSRSRKDDTIRQQIFQPLTEELEDLLTVSYFKEHLTSKQHLYISLDTTLETSHYFSKLFRRIYLLSSEFHNKKFERRRSLSGDVTPPIMDIQEENSQIESLRRGRDKISATKTRDTDRIEFFLSGEQILSGQKFFERCLKYTSDELPYLHFLCAVRNPMSKAQVQRFSPLSIIITSVNFLPVDKLKKQGVTKIKLSFLICNKLLAESNVIPIDKTVRLNHARTIFTHAIDKGQLIYFIQTGGLNIELLGYLGNSQVELTRAQDDERESTISSEQKFVCLGKAFADISSILFQPYKVDLECNLKMSHVYERENNNEFTSINEFNSSHKRKGGTVSFLEDSNPTLKLIVGLGNPLTDIWQSVTMNPDLFNRIFIVLHNIETALPIVQIIQSEVDEVLGLTDYLKNGKNLKRPDFEKCIEGSENNVKWKNTEMTGFVIDCVDEILIYAESSVFGGIQKIWASVSCLNPLQGRVLYDSSLIFLDRLYTNFFKFGGFMGITLKESPEVILSKAQSYKRQSIPRPAWRALSSLKLLGNCKSIKTASQNNFFPDFRSLASLAIEFGTPMQIKATKPPKN